MATASNRNTRRVRKSDRVVQLGIAADIPEAFRVAITRRLIPWFRRTARDMPWRSDRTPYRVWISELMLQQTRVDQVIPYYQRFMKVFPTVQRLAQAPLQSVLKQWEGLGYYARARNMHRTAKALVDDHNGQFPSTYKDLLALPGIGPYTAAAVSSLAFNQNHAVVDGNVIRVLSRLFAYDKDPKSAKGKQDLQAMADALLPSGRAALYNEALMELGATGCLPRRPACARCPLRTVCRAYASGDPEAFPLRTTRKPIPHKEVGCAVVTRRDGKVLIAQRRETSMLGGLWEFPGGGRHPDETMKACIARELKEELDIEVDVGERFMQVQHAYSHFRITLDVHWATLRRGRPKAIECADFAWANPSELTNYPFSKADLYIVKNLTDAGLEARKVRAKYGLTHAAARG